MAAKKATSKKKSAPKSKSDLPLENRICEAALKRARGNAWDAIRLDDIAKDLGLSFGELIAACPTHHRLVTLLFRRIDQTMLLGVRQVDRTESVRDRLFDVLMARFDAMQSHRTAYAGLIGHLIGQPEKLLGRVPHTLHAMALALIAAGVDAGGLKGMVRAQVLAVTYASVLRVWLKDESADMAKTMSALDKGLARLERGVKFLARKGGSEKGSNGESHD